MSVGLQSEWPTSSSRSDNATHVVRLLLPTSCQGRRTVLLQLPKQDDVMSPSSARRHGLLLRRGSLAQISPKRFEL